MVTPTLIRRVGDAAGTIVSAVTHPPYGWGTHRDFEQHSDHNTVIVTFEEQPVQVEYYHFPAGPHAPTVFIFNGFTANASVYGPLGKAIWHHEYNVAIISLPGHGQTDLPTHRPINYADTAKIIIMAMEAIRSETGMVGPISLLGHSHGGGVVEAITAQLGNEVSRAILLAAVGGPEWTVMMANMSELHRQVRSCRVDPRRLATGGQMGVMLLGEGFLMIPPPWQIGGMMEELAIPFFNGFRGFRRPGQLWSVAIDTIVEDAASLEGYLELMRASAVPTACVAGDLDSVINRSVIRTQAKQAGAGVFNHLGTHASFLAPDARTHLAKLVTLPDDEFKSAVTQHIAR